ncbi:MAG TPA: DUF488 domain-containing protein, partial [Candidatus Acidoferrum sp.]|nr:DUF488 domain-containing protein [Candidatus Acidoferrum sp.]
MIPRAVFGDASAKVSVLTLYTIGFSGTSAEAFFGTLRGAGIARVIDTRIHRHGQLSGFAKAPDLPYFLEHLAACAYVPMPSLAPTPELLHLYRTKLLGWPEYADAYLALLRDRKPEREIDIATLSQACLLCSEHTPETCHRRLAAEYFRDVFDGQIEIV